MRTDMKPTAKKLAAAPRNGTELDRRYGKVGIAAVAAAMRYRNDREVAGWTQGARPAARRDAPQA